MRAALLPLLAVCLATAAGPKAAAGSFTAPHAPIGAPGCPCERLPSVPVDQVMVIAPIGRGYQGGVAMAAHGGRLAAAKYSDPRPGGGLSVFTLGRELRALCLLAAGEGGASVVRPLAWVPGPRDAAEPLAILMEHAGNATLKELISMFPEGMPRRLALDLAVQVAGAMAHVHASGVLHRDLRASNVVIDQRGNATVVDFGRAALLGASPNRDGAPLVCDHGAGAPLEYPCLTLEQSAGAAAALGVAPEIIRGERYGRPADVYSFSQLLYSMIDGRAPVYPALARPAAGGSGHGDGEPPFELRRTEEQPLPREVVHGGARPARPARPAPGDDPGFDALWSLLGSCWDPDPARRPTFVEVQARLEELRAAL